MKILAGLPSYDGKRYNGSAVGTLHAAGISTFECQSSLLANAFNRCWTRALNLREDGITHFLMLHADVVPADPDWAERLVREFLTHDCQLLSVAVPIKTIHGLTSTALETGDRWRPRRLTLREIHARPETWTSQRLLVNTGLMIADVRRPWAEQVCFTVNDRISRESGSWVADVEPEDWNFSRQVRALGVEPWVTRAVAVRHLGSSSWRNDVPWGQDHDPNFDKEEPVG